MMRRVPAQAPAHQQRPAPALPSSSGGGRSRVARVALAFLVVGACSIIYYRANYGRTLAASLEGAGAGPAPGAGAGAPSLRALPTLLRLRTSGAPEGGCSKSRLREIGSEGTRAGGAG